MAGEIATQTSGTRGGSGCLVFVVALVGSITWAILQPWYGLPSIAIVVVVGLFYLRRLSRQEKEADARRIAELRTIAAPSGDAWRTLFEGEGLGHLVERVAPLVRRAMRIATRDDCDQVVGGSRIGGSPDLPEDIEWPSWKGAPLPFVAQIALAEVHAVDPTTALPADGYLWFFHDVKHWGEKDAKGRGAETILFRPGHDTLVRRRHPDGEEFTARAVVFEVFDDIPDLLETVPALSAVGEADAERYFVLRSYLSSGGDGAQHKLLGWSDPVQGDVETESGLEDARLLLQLDSDDDAHMMWGDLGKLYFIISARDLAAARFDAVRLVVQCT